MSTKRSHFEAMTKTTPLGIRFSPGVKVALDQAAKDEARSLSNLIERVMSEWLRSKGYLPKTSTTSHS